MTRQLENYRQNV